MSDEKRIGSPVTPVLTQRGVFIPEVGRRMVLALPGENVSGEVVERLSDDVLVMKITGIVLNKAGHGYRTNDHVPCERGVNDLGIEQWQLITKRDLEMREEAERIARARVQGI